MDTDLTAREIKDIRTRYGLSQQAFARVLGLGEASIVRYENGQKPTRANANLIRAAKNQMCIRYRPSRSVAMPPIVMRKSVSGFAI